MADDVYQGPANGDWFDPKNWSLGVVPDAGSTAYVDGTNGVTIDNGVVSDVTIDLAASTTLRTNEAEPTGYNLYVGPAGLLDGLSTVVVDEPIDQVHGDALGASIHLGTFDGQLLVTDQSYLDDYDTVLDDKVTVTDGGILALYSGYAETSLALDQIAVDGSIVADDGQVRIFADSIVGSGTVTLENHAALLFLGPTDAANVSVNVDFADGSEMLLAMSTIANYSGTITGFGGDNEIGLADTYVAGQLVQDTISFADGVLTVDQGNATVMRIRFSGDYSIANFNVSSYNILSYVPCFAAGTRISVPGGEVAVEDLVAGDLVRTASGEARAIVWAGRRHVDLTSHPDPVLARPVVIRAHAFAPGVPVRDLAVSPDHNIAFDGVLIPAKCLVDGRSVFVDERAASVTYHHIELATHDLVLAEGLEVETYLDVGNRAALLPGAAGDADFSSTVDLNWFRWEALGCRRLVLAGPALDRARALLRGRTEAAALAA